MIFVFLQNKKGYTLIEFMYVFVIVGILLSGSMLATTSLDPKSMANNKLTDETVIFDTALSNYYVGHNHLYPASMDILKTQGYIANTSDLSKFSYSTNGGYQGYTLTMTNGALVYTSPGSKTVGAAD